jgi:hypothetical protein
MYCKEYEFSIKCPICSVSQYNSSYSHVYVDNMKNKKSTIGLKSEDDIFDEADKKRRKKKRLFLARDDELVHWYSANCRKNDEEIRHSSNGIRWKISYLQYLEFTKEDRNVRFALIIDGMNPLEENKTVYNTRSMILVMYNLLTWLCHKRKYLMLYILIQGLKRTGIDIDVFLEDMTKMWNEGVRTGVFHAICHHICYCH